MFECDKLIFTAQMAFQILLMKDEINPLELDFLLRWVVLGKNWLMIENPRFPTAPNITSPVDFISNIGWGAIKVPGIARDSM